MTDAPERRCLVTRESGPRDGLVRFVTDPDGRVVPDVDERLPGRGLWVTADRECIAEAVAKRLFARAARQSVTVDAGLVDRVQDQLLRRCVEGLALARRAGLAVVGQAKVRAALESGVAGVLVEAVDAAPTPVSYTHLTLPTIYSV